MEMVGGGEDVGLMSLRGMVDATTSAMNPLTAARESARLYGEWLKIMTGKSAREVPAKDWRFADPAWRDHPMYKRLAQGYLAFCDAIDRVVDDNPDWRKRERARFLTGILTSAMAPTNTLIGNPAALKKAFETGGRSLVRGTQNLVDDLRHNKGMPSQVKRSDFKLGVNLAATPGAVVLRTERFELLRYQPTTAKVREIPTLIVPPPIGKFYFIDLAPGRSFTEYAVAKGFQIFTMSWRNPQQGAGRLGHRRLRQVDPRGRRRRVQRQRKQESEPLRVLRGRHPVDADAELHGGGGRQAHQCGVVRRDAARLGRRGADRCAALEAADRRRAQALARSRHPSGELAGAGVRVDATQRSRLELLGQQLPDRQRSAELRHPRVERRRHQSAGQAARPVPRHLREQRAAEAGQPQGARQAASTSKIKVQTLVTGGTTDHLTPWKGCYRTTQLLGGPTHVRAEQRRARRVARQSAGQPEGDLLARSEAGTPIPSSGWRRRPSTPARGGKCGSTGRASAAAARSWRRKTLGNASTRCSATRRAPT